MTKRKRMRKYCTCNLLHIFCFLSTRVVFNFFFFFIVVDIIDSFYKESFQIEPNQLIDRTNPHIKLYSGDSDNQNLKRTYDLIFMKTKYKNDRGQ